MYPPETIEMPETVGKWYPGQPASLLVQSCGQMGLDRIREEYREGWSAYFGLVSLIDDCVGRVVQALKRAGIWDDALVIFTQDHGDMLGCHHLMQKQCLYEEAAHLPMLVKPPGGGAGRRSELVSAIDFCPSVCDYAGVPPPEGVQGISWRPLAQGKQVSWRDRIFMEYNGDQGRNIPVRGTVAFIRGQRWKYIYTTGDLDELFCLDRDPLENESLVQSPEHQHIRSELRASLAQWMAETGDFAAID